MAFWLLKTEPSDYSFQDLARDRETVWDGIGNALALKNLSAARNGDHVLIYHTGKERCAVGMARLTSDPYPDPEREDPKRLVAKVRVEKALPTQVSLAEMKGNRRLEGFDLLRIPRLSFVPVSAAHWKEILRMAGAR